MLVKSRLVAVVDSVLREKNIPAHRSQDGKKFNIGGGYKAFFAYSGDLITDEVCITVSTSEKPSDFLETRFFRTNAIARQFVRDLINSGGDPDKIRNILDTTPYDGCL